MTWAAYGALVEDLVSAIRSASYEPTCIVGVARGGLPVATSLAAQLKVDNIQVVSVARTVDDRVYAAKENPVLRFRSFERLDNQRVLVAEDIVGTGETWRFVDALVRAAGAVSCECAALASSVHAAPAPRFAGRITDEWVVFPWESPPDAKRSVVSAGHGPTCSGLPTGKS